MKVKSSTYAEVLANIIFEKKVQPKEVSRNFLKVLQKHGDMKRATEIIEATEQLLLKKTGNKKITLETARKIKDASFARQFAKKGDMVKEKINPALIAGVKVVVNDNKQLDFSLQSKLNNIF